MSCMTQITVNVFPPRSPRHHGLDSHGTSAGEKSRRPSSYPGNVPKSIDDIPYSLRGPQYDGMIVYAPQEEGDMNKFKYIVENYIKFSGNVRPSLCMYSCDSEPNFEMLQDLVERTSIFFIYSTRPDFGNSSAVYKKDEIVSRCIQNPSNRIVPVLPNKSLDPPSGMKSLKALYLDKFFRGVSIKDVSLKQIEYSSSQCLEPSEVTALIRLFNHGLKMKQERQLKQQKNLKAWIREQIRTSQINSAFNAEKNQPTGDTNKAQTVDSLKQSKRDLDKRLSYTERNISKSVENIGFSERTQDLSSVFSNCTEGNNGVSNRIQGFRDHSQCDNSAIYPGHGSYRQAVEHVDGDGFDCPNRSVSEE